MTSTRRCPGSALLDVYVSARAGRTTAARLRDRAVPGPPVCGSTHREHGGPPRRQAMRARSLPAPVDGSLELHGLVETAMDDDTPEPHFASRSVPRVPERQPPPRLRGHDARAHRRVVAITDEPGPVVGGAVGEEP